jgi:hypothetical protein
MTSAEFLELYQAMAREELVTFQAKNADYADRTGGNVLSQFDRLAWLLDVTPEMVLMIYLEKHLIAPAHKPIAGRIKDARVYLAMLRAMVERGGADESRA